MALQVALELDSGINLPAAYVRMTSGFLSIDEMTALIAVQYFASSDARWGGKPPVLIKQFLCGNAGYAPAIQAKYELNLVNIAVGSGKEIALDLDANGTDENVLIEGTNLTTDGTIKTLTANVVSGLNAIANFNTNFVASSTTPGVVIVEALSTGTRTGAKGNGIIINGNAVTSLTQTVKGVNMIPSPFMTYFNLDIMNQAGVNVISQGYEFLKSLPDFEGYVDLLP